MRTRNPPSATANNAPPPHGAPPLEAQRGNEEVQPRRHPAESGAGSAIDASQQTRDQHDDGRDEQPVAGEVDGDSSLYQGRRVHGLPSSSFFVLAR